VRLNSRKVLRGVIEAYGIDPAKETGVLTALDKVDKVGWDGVVEELVRDRGLGSVAAEALADALKPGAEDEFRGRLRSSEVGGAGLDEVDRLIDLVGPLLADGRIVFSPSLARGLSYYTGPIFEIFVEGSSSAISSGGRYDGLVGMFAGRSIPAVGGSLGIERIIPLVAGSDEASVASPAQVLVTVWDPGFRAEALATAGELRGRGIAAEVYLGEDKLGEQLGYASSRGIPLAVIRGAREREQGVVTVRDLRTREQAAVPGDDLAAHVAERLS